MVTSDENLYEVMAEYQEKFKDSVQLIGLREEDLDKAPDLIRKAIDEGKPYTDTSWFMALGYDTDQMPDRTMVI
jgi:hypothetical protein